MVVLNQTKHFIVVTAVAKHNPDSQDKRFTYKVTTTAAAGAKQKV